MSVSRYLLAIALLARTRTATSQQFEVASVKINDSGSGLSGSEAHAGVLTGTNLSLKSYIRIAYRLKEFQILGPEWLDSDSFDIHAKGSPDSGREAFRPMLQALLAERFKLRFHMESRELKVYSLVAAKGGPKIQDTHRAPEGSTDNGRGHLTVHGASMARFAEVLSRQTDLPVVDATALPGTYDIVLDWVPEERNNDAGRATDGASLFTALQEQLGLRLQAGRTHIAVLVVDRAERTPLPN